MKTKIDVPVMFEAMGWTILCGGLLSLISSCYKFDKQTAASASNGAVDYNVVVIDNCQYLEMATYGRLIVTHKGDCTNSIHCRHGEK